MGTPAASQISFVKAFDTSSRAAAAEGPKDRDPGDPAAGPPPPPPAALPAPTITRSTAFFLCEDRHQPAVEHVDRGAFGDPRLSLRCRVPRSPGRTWGSASPPRPSACSRAAAAQNEDVHGPLPPSCAGVLGSGSGEHKTSARRTHGPDRRPPARRERAGIHRHRDLGGR